MTQTGPTTQAHLLIRASAGTGKTYSLSNRYLTLLAMGAQPQTILATTFTRKAAGEILERILKRLATAARDDASAAQLAEQLRLPLADLAQVRRMLNDVTQSLHHLSVSTIDSFFHRMVQCFRYELDIPPGATIIADGDPVAVQLRRQAIDAMLTDEPAQVLIDLLRHLHHDTSQRRVTAAIDDVVSQLYDIYRQTDARAWSCLPTPDTLDRATLVAAIERLNDAKPHVKDNKRQAKAFAVDYQRAVAQDWDAFVSGGLAARIAANESMYYRNEIPSEVIDAYKPTVAHAKALVMNRQARRTTAMFELLKRFDQHYQRLRRQSHVMLFSDLPHKLARELPALGDDVLEDVYYRLDQRVTHLLLDEFQDTSSEQWRILLPFAQEILAAGDPSAMDRTFFCVGDEKQAIYGWRGGCAAIFEQVEKDLHLDAGASTTLSQSWRTSPPVLDAVNRVFERIADAAPLAQLRDAAAKWQDTFTEHTTVHADRPGYATLITSQAVSDNERDGSCNADTGDDGKGVIVGAGIATPHDCCVADLVADLSLEAPGRSIGVLVRRNNTVRTLIDLLRHRNVAASGEGGTPLTDDSAVGVVLSAMMLADHPGNQAAAFHVRHSPLAKIVGMNAADPAHVCDVAAGIRTRLLVQGYAHTISDWARKLAEDCDQRNVVRLTQLVELADRYDAQPSLRADDFVMFVRGTSVEEPTTSPVRVMTVHKAKGLEFDIVVLPELSGTLASIGGLTVWTNRSEPTSLPSAVFAAPKKTIRTVIEPHCEMLKEAHVQEQWRRLHDDLSALYVALTRARFALHMIVEPLTQTDKGQLSTIGTTNQSYASILRTTLCEVQEHYEGDQLLYEHGDRDWHTRVESSSEVVQPTAAAALPLRVAFSKPRAAGRSCRQVTPSRLADNTHVSASNLLDVRSTTRRLRGSVIHAWFSLIEWLDESGGVPADDELIAAARPIAATMGDDWLREQLRRFHAMLEHEAVCDVLRKPADSEVELWRERPFLVRIEDRLIRGAFDRVTIQLRKSGAAASAHIIDFKTDSVTNDSDLERLVDKYRPQVASYREVVAHMLQLDHVHVKAMLLFVTADRATAQLIDQG